MAIKNGTYLHLAVALCGNRYADDLLAEIDRTAANVTALAGTLTGTVTGTMVNTAASACAGGSTPTAANVDTCVATLATAVNVQLKELQTKVNAEIAALKAANLQASS